MSNYLNQYMAEQSSLIVDKIAKDSRVRGRMSAMIRKGNLPKGTGWSWQNLIVNRSVATAGDWTAVSTPAGSTNNCTPTALDLAPAVTTKTFTAAQKLIRSHKICFTDAMAAYDYEDQIRKFQENMADEVVDQWEDRDMSQYITNCQHKMIANTGLSESTSAFPTTQPSRYLDMTLLNILYTDMLQDGAGSNGKFPTVRGAPQFPIFVSSEQLENVISRDATTRLAFEYAEMGEADNATLLKSWAADRALGGWLFIVNNKMPRYDFVNGAWVERTFYANTATTIGNVANVSAAYRNAQYELVVPFHPDVAVRLTPTPIGSVGGMTSGRAVNFNGDIIWVNAVNTDPSSDEYNPLGNQGRFYAPLMAAYKSENPKFGRAIMVKRCVGFGAQTACYS